MLHNKGILNLIVYANLVFGNPKLTTTNIREMLFQPDVFARIMIPRSDRIQQNDAWNCGLYVCITMLEMSLCQSRKYQKMDDFTSAEEKGGGVFYLKEKDWFKLYKDPAHPPSKTNPGKAYPSLPDSLFAALRNHTTVLFNRILSMKLGQIISPRYPKLFFPKYIKLNFRRHVWEITDNDQLAINNLQRWLKGEDGHMLQNLLKCKNNVVTRPELIFAERAREHDGDNPPEPLVTIKQMVDLGMQEVIVLDSSSLDEEDDATGDAETEVEVTLRKVPLVINRDVGDKVVDKNDDDTSTVTEDSGDKQGDSEIFPKIGKHWKFGLVQETGNDENKTGVPSGSTKWDEADLQPILPSPKKRKKRQGNVATVEDEQDGDKKPPAQDTSNPPLAKKQKRTLPLTGKKLQTKLVAVVPRSAPRKASRRNAEDNDDYVKEPTASTRK